MYLIDSSVYVSWVLVFLRYHTHQKTRENVVCVYDPGRGTHVCHGGWVGNRHTVCQVGMVCVMGGVGNTHTVCKVGMGLCVRDGWESRKQFSHEILFR